MPTGLRTQFRAPYGVHPLNSVERRATETKVITEKRRCFRPLCIIFRPPRGFPRGKHTSYWLSGFMQYIITDQAARPYLICIALYGVRSMLRGDRFGRGV
ncbi:hypothetical protein CPSG_02797 [Coccidioides posadasii str. Silveira]|uniref:Uncharacterized protein n=1 Tax=Coccidioides posadasii (strain RMSCC 757 / Silveira) TaxID=443226 RepID=E9CYC7_COCPS|nr:hypothetical protein CPSG_02797 [Coccidioides posadasii str. Silveira]